jgi:hypothetical protein
VSNAVTMTMTMPVGDAVTMSVVTAEVPPVILDLEHGLAASRRLLLQLLLQQRLPPRCHCKRCWRLVLRDLGGILV